MDRLELIEALKHTPNRLEAAIAGLSPAAIRYRPAEGEWSVNEVLGHVRDHSELWAKRLHQVWSQNDPVFIYFDEAASVRDHAYQDASASNLLADLRKHRMRIVDLLSHAVDWTRLGNQPGVGRRTLRQFAERILDHDDAHLAQIEALKTGAGASTHA